MSLFIVFGEWFNPTWLSLRHPEIEKRVIEAHEDTVDTDVNSQPPIAALER
jgi:hypothetical protein